MAVREQVRKGLRRRRGQRKAREDSELKGFEAKLRDPRVHDQDVTRLLKHPKLLEIDARLSRELKEARQEWSRRPCLHTQKFEERWSRERPHLQDSSLRSKGRAEVQARKLTAVTKSLNWSTERANSFSEEVISYRRDPSLLNYYRVRQRYPEVDILVQRFNEVPEPPVFEEELAKHGIDALLMIAATRLAYEPAVDTVCLYLIQALVSRERIPNTGPGVLQKRREAISDSTVNYLLMMNVDGFDSQKRRSQFQGP